MGVEGRRSAFVVIHEIRFVLIYQKEEKTPAYSAYILISLVFSRFPFCENGPEVGWYVQAVCSDYSYDFFV